MQRFARTGRGFVLVLFDVDHLKKINDRHGHVTGSRVLCRAADAMRQYCRAMDTAARYGGDEFALVLPESTGAAAHQIIGRVAAHLVNDGESPPVSVSGGFAVYPDDGDSVERLLEAADRRLYDQKRDKVRGVRR
jgi:diguanylate cyclase (GGDEF)-like protein